MKIQDVVLERWVRVGLAGSDCDIDQKTEHGATMFTLVRRSDNRILGRVAIQMTVTQPSKGALLTMIKVDDDSDFQRTTEMLVKALADRADEANIGIIADPRGFDQSTARITIDTLRFVGGFVPDSEGFLYRNPGSMRFATGRVLPA